MTQAAGDKGVEPMRSPVNWALLGLVIERPSYGYELARRFERVYEGVLSLSGDSHAYKALNALEGRSMVRGTSRAGAGSRGTPRQPKRHYRATPAGERGYREQLVEQMREDRRRAQLLVRQLEVFTREPLVALEILERIEEAFLEEAVRAPVPPPGHLALVGGSSGLVDRLAGEESRLAMEAKLPWFRYARREFSALAEGRGARQ